MRRLQSALMALTINQVSIVCMHESRVFLQCLSSVTVISKLLKGHSTAKHRAPAYSRAGHQLIHSGQRSPIYDVNKEFKLFHPHETDSPCGRPQSTYHPHEIHITLLKKLGAVHKGRPQRRRRGLVKCGHMRTRGRG